METAQSTPVGATAPTPLSTSFMKGEGGSNHATPTSATSANRSGTGSKKNKKSGGGDDSETDSKDAKKARTNFGVTRK
jgi:chromatin modification-related protein EAF6